MRKVIIFDLGGVLEVHNEIPFLNYIKSKFNLKEDIYPIYKEITYLRDIDKIDEHEFFKRFSKRININISEKEFYDTYYKNYVKQNFNVLNFIKKELFGKYELFIFSNNSRIHIRKFKQVTNFEKLFNKCIYSYDIKVKKPDIKFFKRGLKLIKHSGSECIFFDDQLKSKENSQKVGIKFIQYKNLNKLKKDLNF